MELKQGFKQTEVGVIPEDWQVKSMGETGENIIGLTYSPKDVREYGHLVLRSSNIQNNKLAFENNVFVEMELPKRVIVKENDILICVRNGSKQLIGKCALIDIKTEGSAFGAFMSVYRTSSAKYIFHQFQSNVIQRQIDEVMGATINQLTNKNLASFKIPFPKEEVEQTAIATALSDVDELISQTEKLIEKKKAIKQGVMQELLRPKEGWVFKKLGDYGKTYGGITGKGKGDFGKGSASYIPFMNIMSNSVIDVNNLERVNILAGEFQNKVQCGDLFFNGSSETPEEVGLCSVLDSEVNNVFLNSFCFGYRLNKRDELNGYFLSYLFRSPLGRTLIFSLAQGATRYNLSKTNLLKLKLPIPSKEEQDSIAKVFIDIDDDLKYQDMKLQKLKLQKQGMMQTLLTGKIRLV